MTSVRPHFVSALAAIALATAAGGQGGIPPAQIPPMTDAPSDRLVARFDFEPTPAWDPEVHRDELPRELDRRVDERHGFPKFGHVDLDDQYAAEGTNWSVRFRLAGGSMSAYTRTNQLGVQRLADHRVRVRVRTDGLEHAGARVSAWLHDQDLDEIPGSRIDGELVRTGGVWRAVELLVPGESEDAAGLMIDLQVLQAAQAPHPRQAVPDLVPQPVLRDTSGTVWFDEIEVWQVARIDLATQAPHNIIVQPETPRLTILVRDLARSALVAQLVVRDLSGETVFEQRFRAPHGRVPATMELPLTRCGWYEATAEVSEDDRLLGRSVLPFAIRPADAETGRPPTRAIGVQVRANTAADLAAIRTLVDHVGAGGATIDSWIDGIDPSAIPEHLEAVRHVLDALLAQEVEVAFDVREVPPWTARLAGVDTTDVVAFFAIGGLLARDGAMAVTPRTGATLAERAELAGAVRTDPFVSYVRSLLIHFGLSIKAWQLGDVPRGVGDPELLEQLAAAGAEVERIVPAPQLRVPVRAEEELPPVDRLPAVAVEIPWRVRPQSIPEYLPGWLDDERDVLLHLEPLPIGPFTRRQQTADLAFRTLHAWRQGADRLAIESPWQRRDDQVVPTTLFSAWRGLAGLLRDRTFVGELPLAEGVQCWMLAGDRPDRDALLIWSDARPGAPPTTVNMLLGPGPATLTDLFGNTESLPIIGNRHAIPVGDLPASVSDIDLHLAQFRASVAIEPNLVPATHRVHEHELVMRNPWDIGVTGTVYLSEVPGARVSPKSLRFTIAPGEELRRPLEIVLERGIVAGRKAVIADVHVEAIDAYDVRIATEVEIGWADAEMITGWQIVHNDRTGEDDLHIRLGVTNRSDRALNLDALIRAEGVPLQTRVIAGLQPGTPVNKFFRIANGGQLLAGRTVRVAVLDRDGLAQLNHLLEIPAVEQVATGQ